MLLPLLLIAPLVSAAACSARSHRHHHSRTTDVSSSAIETTSLNTDVFPSATNTIIGDEADSSSVASMTVSQVISTMSTEVASIASSTSGSARQPFATIGSTFMLDLDHQPIDSPILTTDTGLQVDAEFYVVDMAGSTEDHIATYHANQKKVMCYFSSGTWDPYNPDALAFDPACYCGPGVSTDSEGRCTGDGADNEKQPDWDEWFFDLHSPSCVKSVRKVQALRIQNAAEKGCDGIDPDNVDSWQGDNQNFGITKEDSYNHLMWLAATANDAGLAIDLKNSVGLLQEEAYGANLVKAFDFVIIESCSLYENECENYDAFLAAGKPQIRLEYLDVITTCPALPDGQKLLVYSGKNVDSPQISLSCQ